MVETVLSKEQILAAFKRLNADDQLVVYRALREFVPGAHQNDDLEFEISDELKADLDSRWARMQADPSASVSWEEVRAAVDQRLRELP